MVTPVSFPISRTSCYNGEDCESDSTKSQESKVKRQLRIIYAWRCQLLDPRDLNSGTGTAAFSEVWDPNQGALFLACENLKGQEVA